MSSRPLQPTATPGIYQRGGRYVVVLGERSARHLKRHVRRWPPAANAASSPGNVVDTPASNSIDLLMVANSRSRTEEVCTMPGVGTIGGPTTGIAKDRLLTSSIKDLNRVRENAAEATHAMAELRAMAPTQREFEWKINNVRIALESLSENALNGYRSLVRYGLENRVKLTSHQLEELDRLHPNTSPAGSNQATVGQLLETAVIDASSYEGELDRMYVGSAPQDVLSERFQDDWDFFSKGALRDAVQAAESGAALLQRELARLRA
jgi:hypothetical protein